MPSYPSYPSPSPSSHAAAPANSSPMMQRGYSSSPHAPPSPLMHPQASNPYGAPPMMQQQTAPAYHQQQAYGVGQQQYSAPPPQDSGMHYQSQPPHLQLDAVESFRAQKQQSNYREYTLSPPSQGAPTPNGPPPYHPEPHTTSAPQPPPAQQYHHQQEHCHIVTTRRAEHQPTAGVLLGTHARRASRRGVPWAPMASDPACAPGAGALASPRGPPRARLVGGRLGAQLLLQLLLLLLLLELV